MQVIMQQVYSQNIHFIFENTKAHEVCQDFLVKGQSIEDHVTKVVEWIVIDFGLLILYKTKYL